MSENVIANAAAHDAGAAWISAAQSIGHLEYAVRRDLGRAFVRRALDDAAKDLAAFVDGANGKEQAKRAQHWRQRLLGVMSSDGREIREAQLEALYGDVATEQTRNAMWRRDSGVAFQKQSDNHFALNNASGDVLLTLPPLAGRAVRENPDKYGAQIRLLAAGMSSDDPRALHRLAMNVFSNLHEAEHDGVEHRLLYKPTESRANAFVDSLTNLRNAKTDAEKQEAAAVLRTTLFAEAAPKNRLASLGLDLFTPVGNVNAANALRKEASEAYADFNNGKVLDGALHTMWAAVELTGAVSGVRIGKFMREAARTTPHGRAIVAARDLARMQASAQKSHASVPPEVIIGRRRWEAMDEDQQAYFRGVLANAAGQVGEARMTDTLSDAGFDSFKRQEAIAKEQGKKRTPAPLNPTRYRVLPQRKGGTRIFDDAAVGQTLETFMGLFARPKANSAKTTVFEHKSLGATKTDNQLHLEKKMEGAKDKYGHLEIIDLHTPYNEFSKKDLRNNLVRLMTDPNLRGQQYITSGVYKTDKTNPNSKPRFIRWEPDEIEKMVKATERSLTTQHWLDKAPTIGDFFLGFSARLASQEQATEGTEPKYERPIGGYAEDDLESKYND